VGESLPPTVRGVLERLGLWQGFLRLPHDPCHGTRSIWGQDRVRHNDHFLDPTGQGFHVDRAAFDAWLAEQARQAGAAHIQARVTRVGRDATSAFVGNRHLTVRARALVDATGAHAALGTRLGALRLPHDRLLYLARTVPAPPGLPAVGLLEAVPEGWWYASRLPSGLATVALTTDPALARAQDLHQPLPWLAALGRTRLIDAHLGHALRNQPPQAPHPWLAPSALLGPPAGPDWLAVGDAAASWDPITAQGMHKALLDGLRAAAALHDHLDGNAHAIGLYVRRTVAGFRTYLRQRAALYAREPRFASAPFWRRRHARRNLADPRSQPRSQQPPEAP